MRPICAVLIALLLTASARAEDYPSRHINVIIPAGAGALPNTIMRLLGEPTLTPAIVAPSNRPSADETCS
jgi:tripartite-type tricarboxylate transporter receptor subunit TctC